MLNIRSARPDDRPFLLALAPRRADFSRPAWRTVEEIALADQALLLDVLETGRSDAVLLVAESVPEGPVGYVCATSRRDYFTQLAHAHVEVLVVEHCAQGRGVGSALIRAVERWACERGYTFITLNAFAGNTRARGLYERLGYEPETLHYRKAL
jgi:ribosomal protein S18 acetylase RimI-like enzyme